MLEEYFELLKSRDYEVKLCIESKDLFVAKFPSRIQYPTQSEYEIEYDLTLYPRYVTFHLTMGDIIRRCIMMRYDVSLISMYYQDKQISFKDFVSYIQMSAEDRIKHNQVGDLIQAVAQHGFNSKIINVAKKQGIFEYLKLVTKMSGII